MTLRKNVTEKIEKLYELYEQKMYHTAFSILRDCYLAEDAVQEAFVRLLNNLDSIKNPESTATKYYILRTIKSASIDIYRKRQKELERLTILDDTLLENTSKGDCSDSFCITTQEETMTAVHTLPDIYREVIQKRYIEQLSVKETAVSLHISEAAVRKRCERAVRLLKKKLGGMLHETLT